MEQIREKRGITGNQLKLIAVISMLIDHIGAVVMVRFFIKEGIWGMVETRNFAALEALGYKGLGILYYVMRNGIGRIAFPIYCFLLVEGFMHTRNVYRYAGRLFLFAVISEIPFDLAFADRVVYWGYQNVFFTLFMGLVVMILFRLIEQSKIAYMWKALLGAAAFAAGAGITMIAETDYGSYGIGVICIMALYLFRYSRKEQIFAGCITFAWEVTAPLAFIPVAFYKGERGRGPKYLFYLFYPAHLLILYLISDLCQI